MARAAIGGAAGRSSGVLGKLGDCVFFWMFFCIVFFFSVFFVWDVFGLVLMLFFFWGECFLLFFIIVFFGCFWFSFNGFLML